MSKKLPNLCKFHGKFKDLIPNGFKFHKLFARNYRCYSKSKHEYSSQSIWVWQHLGGYIELNDFHDASKTIIESIVTNTFPIDKDKTFAFIRNTQNRFALNLEDNSIEPWNCEVHDPVIACVVLERSLGLPHTGKEHIQRLKGLSDELYAKWRCCTVSDEQITYIKDMYDKGWIKI
jgi:hypothetical protein